MNSDIFEIANIFKSLGRPKATYVKRQEGEFEKRLNASLNAKGKLCLLTGPSKTGKTTLFHEVLQERKEEALVVRCDGTLSADEFWRKALEKINFERITEIEKEESTKTSGSGKIGGTIGWAWLAGLIGEVSIGIDNTMTETQVREKILAKPSPDHLVPLLKKFPFVLVVEDFHYLRASVKKHIFQQWKTFVDSEVSVIVVGTTHHAVDLAYANKDLVGRISSIEVSSWETKDLIEIVNKGFLYMSIPINDEIPQSIAEESVGLPIITQATCQQMFTDKELSKVNKGQDISFNRKDTYVALNHVAIYSYSQFQGIYNRLTVGPRKGARKYDTYELVLSAFSKDPLTFSLGRHDIDSRLNEMPIPPETIPPQNSINSMLKALENFQKKMDIELLEWSQKEQRLFILEPAFLFYLRWREPRDKPATLAELIASFTRLASIFKLP